MGFFTIVTVLVVTVGISGLDIRNDCGSMRFICTPMQDTKFFCGFEETQTIDFVMNKSQMDSESVPDLMNITMDKMELFDTRRQLANGCSLVMNCPLSNLVTESELIPLVREKRADITETPPEATVATQTTEAATVKNSSSEKPDINAAAEKSNIPFSICIIFNILITKAILD